MGNQTPIQSAVAQTTPSSGGVDQTVVNLARAIRDNESKGNYNAVGDHGTSHGAFQYQPQTWKLYAGQVLGDSNAQMTPENQNAVTYGTLKRFKDSGMDAAQSVAAWNAGEEKAKSGAWQNNIGPGYDTPNYVKNVLLTYQQYKSGIQAPTPPTSPSTFPSLGNTAYASNGDQPAPEGMLQKGLNFVKGVGKSIVQAPATLAIRGGELAGVGLMGGLSKITGDPGYYNRALKAADTDTTSPLGTPVKAISKETPESVAGEAASTVALGVPNPTVAGALIGAGGAMQNNASPLSVAGQAALGGAGGYVLGKATNSITNYFTPESTKLANSLVDAGAATEETAPKIAQTMSETGAVPDNINNVWNVARAKNILTNSIQSTLEKIQSLEPTSIGEDVSSGVSTDINSYMAQGGALEAKLAAEQTALKALTQLHGVPIIQAEPGIASKVASGLFHKVVPTATALGTGLLGGYLGSRPGGFLNQFIGQ